MSITSFVGRLGEGAYINTQSQLSYLVYEFFAMRCRFHYYKAGDALPTIDTLCREFGVGTQTVKAALRRLRDEGYISMHRGQATKVVFQETRQDPADFVRRFFSERTAAMPDLCRTVELISIPLLAEGFRRADEEDFTYLAPYLERAGSDDLLYYFSYILQKLENPLAMNLFWETSLYMGLMFIGEDGEDNMRNNTVLQDSIRSIIAARNVEDWAGLQTALVKHQCGCMELALQYIGQFVQPAESQKPFVWRIYRGRPQMCYGLALRIQHETYWGEYGGQRYLPSYEKMARKYNASVSTMRRTVHILCQAGAAETVNGVGTRVFSVDEPCRAPDFADPSVRRNLALYFQSYEMLVYSCEDVARMVFHALTPQELAELAVKLEGNVRSGQYELSLWHILICIAERSPLLGVREVYAKTYGLFLWGYPLKASISETPKLDRQSARFTQAVLRYLEAGDLDQCAQELKRHVTSLFPAVENHLLKHGLTREELRSAPTIRLMLMDG